MSVGEQAVQWEAAVSTRAATSATSAANVAADLDAAAIRTPDKIAVVRADDSDKVTFSELLAAAQRLAALLREAGVRKGDRVAILQGNSWHHVAAWYAVLRCGAICVDLNVALSPEQWRQTLSDCTPAGVITDSAYLEVIAQACADLDSGPHSVAVWTMADADDMTGSSPVEPVMDSDVALIAYTSGTTGLPKGVMHTHRGVADEVSLLIEACGFAGDWVTYVAIPLFSMHGYLPQVAVSVRVSATVLMAAKFDALEFADASRRYAISYTTLSSPMLPSILALPEHRRPDLSSIKILSCGGSPLGPQVRKEIEHDLGVRITEGYGMTEVLGAFVMNIDGQAPYGASGRCYPLNSDTTIRIQDDEGSPVPLGTPGEIAFHRSKTMVGYWPHRDADASDAWFPTGDIGRLDHDGFLFLLDRKKDVILRGGFTIYSAEIERVLAEELTVREAIVVGVPHERVGEVPVAYVVLEDGIDHSSEARRLESMVRERLGALKSVEEVVVVQAAELPRNALGKVVKQELRMWDRRSVAAGDSAGQGRH
jgi:long-chain acyl-CoA synthetase